MLVIPDFLLFLALADTLTAIGTVVTAVWTWFATALSEIETVIATSTILQIALGVTAVPIGLALVGGIIALIKKIASKSGKKA